MGPWRLLRPRFAAGRALPLLQLPVALSLPPSPLHKSEGPWPRAFRNGHVFRLEKGNEVGTPPHAAPYGLTHEVSAVTDKEPY